MSKATAVGLDVGTSRIVMARPGEDGFQYEAQLNAFVDLPLSKMTVTTLRKENVPHTVEPERIVVYGDQSARFADLLGSEMRRSMARGVINPDEPESLDQIERMLERVVGRASSKGQPICFSVPATVPGSTADSGAFHEASLRQVLAKLGYEATAISEGLAVVYAELESTNYTGIGISFGGGLCNVCLAYLSVPVCTFSVAKGGDYIDQSAAAATGELATRMRAFKEDSFHCNGFFADKDLQAISVYYDEMIQTVVAETGREFAACNKTGRFKTPIPVVLSGGSALPKGFVQRFENVLRASECPVQISEVRIADRPLETTAKGALIAALSEA